MPIEQIRIGIAGTRAAKQAVEVTADNIYGNNRKGYVRREAHLVGLSDDFGFHGVRFDRITRLVSESLMQNRRDEVARRAAAEERALRFDRLGDAFGLVDKDKSVSHYVNGFEKALGAMARNVELFGSRKDVVHAAENLIGSIRRIGITLAQERRSAEEKIHDALDEINELISRIDVYNAEIAQAQASGRDISELRDRRDLALDRLAEWVDIDVIERNSGRVMIHIAGQAALDDHARLLAHAQHSNPDSDRLFDPDATDPDESQDRHLGGLYLVDPSTDEHIELSHNIQEGRLSALLEVRDRLLPDFEETV